MNTIISLTFLLLSSVNAHTASSADTVNESPVGDNLFTSQKLGFSFGLTLLMAIGSIMGATLPPLFARSRMMRIEKRKAQLSAGSLAVASGILLFMSLTDLFPESRSTLAKVASLTQHSSLISLVTFCAGVAVVFGLNALAGRLAPSNVQICECHQNTTTVTENVNDKSCCSSIKEKKSCCQNNNDEDDESVDVERAQCECCLPAPGQIDETCGCQSNADAQLDAKPTDTIVNEPCPCEVPVNVSHACKVHQKRSMFGGFTSEVLLTLIALLCHNIPEGLTTFVSLLVLPNSVSLPIVFGLLIHKFPEGSLMATILYPAVTKSFTKMMAIVSFISVVGVMTGAALGCAIIAAVSHGTSVDSSADAMNIVTGFILGFVSGMMSMLVLGYLLPAAHASAVKNYLSRGFVTACIISGALFILVINTILDYLLPQ